MGVRTINYAAGTARKEKPCTPIQMAIWLAFVCLGWFGLCCFVIPRFDMIFRDFHADLPLVTKVVLQVSRLCNDDFGWVALLVLPAIPIVADRLNGRQWAINGASRHRQR